VDLLDILGGLRTYEGFVLVGESSSVPYFGLLSSVLSYDVRNRPRKGGGLSFLFFPSSITNQTVMVVVMLTSIIHVI
jgi:hypothetical protein